MSNKLKAKICDTGRNRAADDKAGGRVKRRVCGCEVARKKVKVIVLAGQSNAVGHAFAIHLDSEQTAKYLTGFENVKIYYETNPFRADPNKSTEFVKVKLGQGKATLLTDGAFGPEIGIAEYLSEIYPDEEFFIIKSATGGTTLFDRWYSPSSKELLGKTELAQDNLYVRMLKVVDDGMRLLSADYDAQIVQFMWMQGETDSRTYTTGFYKELFENMIGDAISIWSEAGYLPDNGLSVVQGGITDYWSNYRWTNLAKRYYADTHSKGYYIDMADAEWCSYDKDNTDYAHLDANSMIAFGREFGKAFVSAVDDLDNPEVVTRHELGGRGIETDPYIISTQYDLLLFVSSVYGGNDYAGKFVKLDSDDLWLDCKIGYGGDFKRYFAGTFDGNNKTVIANIRGKTTVGVFAQTAEGSLIKNLNVKGKIISDDDRAGGIAGVALGKIENCTNYAEIVGKRFVGGIAGMAGSGAVKATVYYCKNYGNVNVELGISDTTPSTRVGGIVGELHGKVVGCVNGYTARETADGKTQTIIQSTGYCVGGIIGCAHIGENIIEGCTNYAFVCGAQCVGGIAGSIYGDAVGLSKTIISNSSDYGNVACVVGVNGGEAQSAGGIVGRVTADANAQLTVTNSIVGAEVTVNGTVVTALNEKGISIDATSNAAGYIIGTVGANGVYINVNSGIESAETT